MVSTPDTSTQLDFTLDRAEFFAVGRALQRGFGRRLLGKVTIDVRDARLTIESAWGGSTISCVGNGQICVEITGKAFCDLITPRFRKKTLSGRMVLSFRPSFKEIASDDVGVRAKFLSLPK